MRDTCCPRCATTPPTSPPSCSRSSTTWTTPSRPSACQDRPGSRRWPHGKQKAAKEWRDCQDATAEADRLRAAITEERRNFAAAEEGAARARKLKDEVHVAMATATGSSPPSSRARGRGRAPRPAGRRCGGRAPARPGAMGQGRAGVLPSARRRHGRLRALLRAPRQRDIPSSSPEREGGTEERLSTKRIVELQRARGAGTVPRRRPTGPGSPFLGPGWGLLLKRSALQGVSAAAVDVVRVRGRCVALSRGRPRVPRWS